MVQARPNARRSMRAHERPSRAGRGGGTGRTRHPIDRGELAELTRALVSAGAPGAAVRTEDEQGVQRAASGVADLRTGRPMEPHLGFRAGSLTKPFVAAVVLSLVAEGRLSLADRVGRTLPGLLPYGDEVDLRQLLNHTSGVPNMSSILWRTLYGSPRGRFRAWSPRELIGLVADRPPEFAPGTAWAYSNANFVLLGLIVESVTGRALGEELARRVVEPLGLTGTTFPVGSTAIPGPSARGYSLALGPDLEPLNGPLVDFTAQDPSYAWAAGGLISTLADLGRFFRALLGGHLLPPRLVAEMLTTVPVPPDALPLPLYHRNGLGIVAVDTPRGTLVGGPGGIPGFLNMTLSTMDGRRQLGVMINIGDRAPDPVVAVFTRSLRGLGMRLIP